MIPVRMIATALAVSTGLALSAWNVQAAGHAAGPAQKIETKKGMVLATPEGLSLYTFDRDKAGVSNCNGGCAKTWPPFMAAADASDDGDFSIITRKDGSKQWAFKGMALYGFAADRKEGDVNGDGVGGTWHLATP